MPRSRAERKKRHGRILVSRIRDNELIVKRTLKHPEKGWRIASDNADKSGWPTRQGVSQRKLAELIGTSASQVSQVEHEQTGTSIRTALAAAQALNVSMDHLLGGVDDPTPTRELVLKLRAKTAQLIDLGAAEPAEEKDLEFDSDDFVAVDKIVASAGSGGDVINEQVTDRVKFRRA